MLKLTCKDLLHALTEFFKISDSQHLNILVNFLIPCNPTQYEFKNK